MTPLLFESPWTVLPVIVLVDLVLLSIWSRRRTRVTARAAVVGLFAVPVAVAMQVLVTTDAERVQDVCRELAAAVERADVAAIAQHVSEDFRVTAGSEAWTKPDLLKRVERSLQQWNVEEQRVSRFETNVTGDHAEVTFQATCRLTTDLAVIPRHVSRWRLTFRREGATWKSTTVQPRKTRLLPYDSLSDLLR